MLGDADAVGARRVDDQNAAGTGGIDIHVVDAGAGAGDHLQSGRPRDQVGIDTGGTADDQRVGVGECGVKLFGGATGLRIDVPALVPKQVGRGRRQRIGNHDFHESGVPRCVSSEACVIVFEQ